MVLVMARPKYKKKTIWLGTRGKANLSPIHQKRRIEKITIDQRIAEKSDLSARSGSLKHPIEPNLVQHDSTPEAPCQIKSQCTNTSVRSMRTHIVADVQVTTRDESCWIITLVARSLSPVTSHRRVEKHHPSTEWEVQHPITAIQ